MCSHVCTYYTECPLPFVDLGSGCFYLLDQTDDFWTAHDNCLTLEAHIFLPN